MKIHRCLLFGLAAGLSAVAVTSCAYDPYYSSSYGGYGDGYGYGNSSFSTSYFVSTGNSRWAYDPYAGAYYDNHRHAYYDPYLSGYYPVGYRPRYVSGAPHPHGWSRGNDYCAPPSSVRSYNLTNYHDRSDRYRNLGRDWSRNVSADSGRDHRQQYDNRDQRQSPQRQSPFGGFQGGSGDRNHDGGRDLRNDGRDDGRREGNGFQGHDRGGRDDSRDHGNTTVTIPQERPQEQPQERPQEQPQERPQEQPQERPQFERPQERPDGGNRGGGEQPNFENRGGDGGSGGHRERGGSEGPPQRDSSGDGGGGGRGDRGIRGIGEG